jgi:hypothetical protein
MDYRKMTHGGLKIKLPAAYLFFQLFANGQNTPSGPGRSAPASKPGLPIGQSKPSSFSAGTKILEHFNIGISPCQNIFRLLHAPSSKHKWFLNFHKHQHTADEMTLIKPNLLLHKP